MLIDLKGEIYYNIKIGGDINTPLSAVDISPRWKQ
jgi:hypothetical protein